MWDTSLHWVSGICPRNYVKVRNDIKAKCIMLKEFNKYFGHEFLQGTADHPTKKLRKVMQTIQNGCLLIIILSCLFLRMRTNWRNMTPRKKTKVKNLRITKGGRYCRSKKMKEINAKLELNIRICFMPEVQLHSDKL